MGNWTGKLLLLPDRHKVCKTAVAGAQLRERIRKSWTCPAGAKVGRGALARSSAHLKRNPPGSSALAKKAAGAFMARRLPTTVWIQDFAETALKLWKLACVFFLICVCTKCGGCHANKPSCTTARARLAANAHKPQRTRQKPDGHNRPWPNSDEAGLDTRHVTRCLSWMLQLLLTGEALLVVDFGSRNVCIPTEWVHRPSRSTNSAKARPA